MQPKNDMFPKLPLRVVGLLVKDGKVLLGKRTEGIGENNYVGIGGKAEKGETPAETLVREVKEEIGAAITSFTQIGDLSFFFPFQEEGKRWDQNVIVFICTEWTGEIQQMETIIPKWFNLDKIPLQHMWHDAEVWMKQCLNGYYIRGDFIYNNDFRLESWDVSATQPAA